MEQSNNQWQEIIPHQRKRSKAWKSGVLSVNAKTGMFYFGSATVNGWHLRSYKSIRASRKPNEPGLLALQFCKDGEGWWSIRKKSPGMTMNARDIIDDLNIRSGIYRGHLEQSGFAVVDFAQALQEKPGAIEKG